jgi:hypothetical protein
MDNSGLFESGLDRNFMLEVAKGNIAGTALFEKYGRNPEVGTATDPEDIWNGGGTYTGFPTGAAETMEIFSSDAADTSAGTGAQTVEISNLLTETGFLAPNITVSLDGTTPVSLGAQTYIRSARMRVLTAGTGGANAGTLTLRHTTTTANIFAVMPINRNRTAILAYTVPLEKKLYLDRIHFSLGRASGAAGSANVTLRSRETGRVFEAIVSPEVTNSQDYIFSNNGFLVFPALTDLKGTVESVSDNLTIATGEWGGLLIDD